MKKCSKCGIEKISADFYKQSMGKAAHTYANTRIAHFLCNVRRGNHGAAQLRMVGE